MAAVYPHGLCKALVKDISMVTDNYAYMMKGVYYMCEKCSSARMDPDFNNLEHSLVPGERQTWKRRTRKNHRRFLPT